MIQCRLFGHDEVHDEVIDLPAVPRIGDHISVLELTHYTLRVNQVRFIAGNSQVVLFVEWVA